MADLLNRVIAEITQRRDELRPLLDEYQRLQAAEATLADSKPTRRAPRHTRPRSSQGQSGKKRAPRGANRQRILDAVGERPGVSTGELAAASGIAGPTLATTVSKLVREGLLERVEQPEGASGLRRSGDAS